MDIRCLKDNVGYTWDMGFKFTDVFLVVNAIEPKVIDYKKTVLRCKMYLKRDGRQVSFLPNRMDMRWAFFLDETVQPTSTEIERYKKLLKGEVEMNDEMVQIEKLEKELAKLREIVEAKKEKKIIYSGENLYVGIDEEGGPFLLSRMDFKYSFLSGCRQWCKAQDDGQKLIDCANKNRPFTIYEFSDRLEGIEFFRKKYREYWGSK